MAMRFKMSECELPFHIQEEIMKRLPVKSLIQFRCVSKAWKSLIDSPVFIAAHCLHRHTQPHHLLVSYENQEDNFLFFRSYVDDDNFPQQRSVLTLPPSVKESKSLFVVGSSRGLLCLYGPNPNFTTKMVVLWNPSIRKSISVDLPYCNSIGFGVCPVTGDPKVVALTKPFDHKNIETSYRYEVMVYTLSSGKWRTLSTNLHTKRLRDFFSSAVTDDGFIYWRVIGFPSHNMLLSFDVTNESFELIDLLDILNCHNLRLLYTSMVPNSLTMLEYRGDICTVWTMEHGAQKLFTKRFTIKAPHEYIVGFRKNGVPIMHAMDGGPPKLVVEPKSEHNNVLEIWDIFDFVDVNLYMETLLLLGRSDCSSY